MKYDSTQDTLDHIERVQELLIECRYNLTNRGKVHDASKLGEYEKPFFDEHKPVLDRFEVTSDDYATALDKLKIGLKHHYENNSHHPEYYGSPSQLDERYLESVETHKAQIEMLNTDLKYYGAACQVKPVPFEYEGGINSMSLFDIIEMLMDHKAASEKTKNGSIQKSLDYGKERFKYSDQLYKILQNTVREMGWE